ncbi:MAG TPA: phosphatidylglycerophosphatase A [Polyangiaceae bacterium]|jgi:phosphatidylglycerophosphatase A
MNAESTAERYQAPFVAHALAKWFGCGNVPVAPGTAGSIGAVPLHLALRLLPPGLHLAAIVATTAVGVWSANEIAKEMAVEDPQCVVIDEVVGTLLAMGMVRSRSIGTQVAALLLFRLFDTWKPGPIDASQRAKPEGVGIVLDDVLAGILAGAVARVIG